MFKVNDKNTRTTSLTPFWSVTSVLLLLTLNKFHTFSRVAAVRFEEVNVSWDKKLSKFKGINFLSL